MFQEHRGLLESKMPKCLKNGGGSIWLRKNDLALFFSMPNLIMRATFYAATAMVLLHSMIDAKAATLQYHPVPREVVEAG
jgi:hypothetical protein